MAVSAYVVGDIHGELDRLHFLLDEIEYHSKEKNPEVLPELIFVGDYIDRGPQSAQVVDLVQKMVESPNVYRFSKVVALKGNHEDMLVRGQYDRRYEGMWLMNGGMQAASSWVGQDVSYATLSDYLDVVAITGKKHYDFLSQLPTFYEIGKCCVAHAGIDDPFLLAGDHDEESLLWSRQLRVTEHKYYKLTVHGHTPQKRPLFGHGVAYIDTGAVFDEKQPLTALYIPDVNNPDMDSLELLTDNGVVQQPTRL